MLTARHTTRLKLLVFTAVLLLSGCSIVRNAEKKIDSIEKEISDRPEVIEKELASTISNMVREDAQYRECIGIATRFQDAEKAYHGEFKAYAAGIKALKGGNPKGRIYLEEDIERKMSGVCYLLEWKATDSDFSLMFEIDKKALVSKAQEQLKKGGMDETRKRDLERRVEQLQHAKPCHLFATDQGLSNRGECGFESEHK
jgi:hypothetical protein